jgi:WD40 repeat protein
MNRHPRPNRLLNRACPQYPRLWLLTWSLLAAHPGSLMAEPLSWGIRTVECVELRLPTAIPPGQTQTAPNPPITALAFTDNGQTLWTASLAGIDLWSWPLLEHTAHLDLAGDHITRLRPAPDHHHVVAVGGSPGESGSVWRFKATGHLEWHRQLSDDLLTDAAWSHDGRCLATTDLHGQLNWLLAESGESLAKPAIHTRGLLGVTYLPGGEVVVGGLDHTLQIHADIGSQTAQRSLTQHTGPVVAVEIAPPRSVGVSVPTSLPPSGGRESLLLVSIGRDRTVRLWQPLRGRLVRFYRLEAAQPTCLAWSEPHGGIVVGDSSGHMSLIEPSTGQLRWSGPVGDSWHFAITCHPTSPKVVFGATRGRLFVAHLTAAKNQGELP